MKDYNLSFRDRVKYETLWWAITLMFSLYVFPALLICMINPIWFTRQALADIFHWQINDIVRWRKRKLEFIFDKYRVFDLLKEKHD